MNVRLVLDGSADATSRAIDLRNFLNASVTITVDDSVGAFTVEGTDDVQKVCTELDTGVDQSIEWADVTAMATDTSGSLSVSAAGSTVVTFYNPPAFVRVFFDRTSGSDPIVVSVTGR